jgi:hypothetical protein
MVLLSFFYIPGGSGQTKTGGLLKAPGQKLNVPARQAPPDPMVRDEHPVILHAREISIRHIIIAIHHALLSLG